MKYEPFDAPYWSTQLGAERDAIASGKLRNDADGPRRGTPSTEQAIEIIR
jgi:hypothetical protein